MNWIDRRFWWVTIFAIAMAYLESAVVVYLRIILYPDGFDFPLRPIQSDLVVTELWREAATLVMLVGAGVLVGRKPMERFAYFLYAFAIWDIFYYVFLKLLIDWPASLVTWDILFLIPVTWTGPVISPLIICILMILMALEFIYLSNTYENFRVIAPEWTVMIMGALTVIVSFCWDYSVFVLQDHSFSQLWSLQNSDLYDLSTSYIPVKFNWGLYLTGCLLIQWSMYMIWRRANRQGK